MLFVLVTVAVVVVAGLDLVRTAAARLPVCTGICGVRRALPLPGPSRAEARDHRPSALPVLRQLQLKVRRGKEHHASECRAFRPRSQEDASWFRAVCRPI